MILEKGDIYHKNMPNEYIKSESVIEKESII